MMQQAANGIPAAAFQLIATLVGALISGVVSFLVFRETAKHQRELADAAGAQQRELAEKADLRKARQTTLEARLTAQCEALQGFVGAAFAALNSAKPDREKHVEAGLLNTQLAMAFGDDAFANQASYCVLMLGWIRPQQKVEMFILEKMAGNLRSEMQRAIGETEKLLDIAPLEPLTPPVPLEEFDDMLAEVRLRNVFLGRPEEQVDAAVERLRSLRAERRSATSQK